MKRHFMRLLAYVLALLPSCALAQGLPPEPKVETTRITGNIFKVTCTYQFSVNVVASVGEDGILIVDSGRPETAEALRAALRTLSDRNVRFVIDTHAHGDHAGGNELLAKEATIVAQVNTRRRLTTVESFFSVGRTQSILPTITFDKELTLFFNGDEIRVLHYPNSHSDGDVLVHFVNSKLVALGDLLFADIFPYVGLHQNGNLENYIANIRSFMSQFEPGTVFVAGHGRTYTRDDLQVYEDMLVKTTEVVRKEMQTGESLDAIKKKDVLKSWDSWVGPWSTTNKNAWIETIFCSLAGKGNLYRQPVEEVLLETIRHDGADAAVQKYWELKKTQGDVYDCGENRINALGYYLIEQRRLDDAIKIFILNVEAYPESWNVYDSLGEAYMLNGQRELAIVHYEKSLQLNPKNSNAVGKLKELRERK